MEVLFQNGIIGIYGKNLKSNNCLALLSEQMIELHKIYDTKGKKEYRGGIKYEY